MKHDVLLTSLVHLLMAVCLWVVPAQGAFAQNGNTTVRGRVVDAGTREPLIGVTVLEKGTQNAAVTDVDGNFQLSVKNGATVSFSYINYIKKDVHATAIKGDITLQEDNRTLQEVVVVGYGTQKKVNLSGSVASVDGATIAAKPATDVLTALQGEIPGLAVLRSGGQPGSEASGVRIRGFSSVNNTSTLVLIDGVEGDMALLNANDIESISVLKDAAASAIYGARAAAGVILITTKKGTAGKPVVQYNGYYGVNTPGNMPERLPAWEEQHMINLGRINQGGKPEWNEEMESWVGNPNFNYRPNNTNGRWDLFQATNWVAEGTKKFTTQTNHSLQVSGGSKDVSYLISGNYYYKDGMLRYAEDDNTRVNLNAKINAQVNKYIVLGVTTRYASKLTNMPSWGAPNILELLYSSRGRQPIYNPAEDTNPSPYNGDLQANAIDIMRNGGTSKSLYENFTGIVNLTIGNFLKGLRFNVNASRSAGYYSSRSERHTLVWKDRLGSAIRSITNNPNSLYRIKNNDFHDLFEATGTYEFTPVKNHNFKLLAGTSYENYRKDEMDATAYNMNSNDFYSFNYYDASLATNTVLGDNIAPWSMMSYFGRLNYNYADKYLLEANVRYDGSSRLAPEKRWKAFPSVSAAWRVNQEQWFKAQWVTNLKLRASYGQLGNGAILGLYDYIPTISDSQGGRPATYMGEKWYYQSKLASTNKTWETIATTNVGVDLGLFKNKLTATFDYYWKYNNDMLSSLQLPHTIGIGVPQVNIGRLKTWGWELAINWNDRIGNLTYQAAFNLSDSQNKLLKYDGASVIGEGNVGLLEGYEMNTIWGYRTNGYWQSRDEYLQYKQEHPGYQTFNDGKIDGGDTRYVAQGTPDHQIGTGQGTPTDKGDLVYLGNSNARYLYGFSLAAQWKGFDFSVMFQGVAKRKMLIDAAALAPFFNTYQMPWTIHRDYWTPENTDAYWPRLYNAGGNDFNFKPSDKWVQNASYLRLKDITLGYTVPLKRVGIQKLRVYVSGNDVWEHSPLLKVYDPESGNNVGRRYYPFFRTWAVGVNLIF